MTERNKKLLENCLLRDFRWLALYGEINRPIMSAFNDIMLNAGIPEPKKKIERWVIYLQDEIKQIYRSDLEPKNLSFFNFDDSWFFAINNVKVSLVFIHMRLKLIAYSTDMFGISLDFKFSTWRLANGMNP
jgi:hypothetical protein